MRDFLRSLPVFAGVMPDFDAVDAPDDPAELFASWLRHAVEEGVPEPHAMTLSTTGPDGAPDARTLILKTSTSRAGGSRPVARASRAASSPLVRSRRLRSTGRRSDARSGCAAP
ncbi:MAG TPA: hypothetical protein VFX25_19390 [Streptosporangiaceae bacterium]|nr:hypothetical protein [Streptosporangiaceae bacterium]